MRDTAQIVKSKKYHTKMEMKAWKYENIYEMTKTC